MHLSGAVSGFLKGPQCFVAGTPVATASGFAAIETIEAGNLVLAADSETGEVAYKKVVQVFKNTTDELTHVTIRSHNGATETIDATPQHPFYVDGIGWVEASSLHEGMTVWFADGSKGTVADISNEGLAEPVAVYNFEVEDFHTYFVGDSPILVHNKCGDEITVKLKYKKGWSPEKKAAARLKVSQLNNATTVKQGVTGRSSTITRLFRKLNAVEAGQDVDHIIDLQLGGSNALSNMQPLDRSVNRSLGR